MTQRWWHRYQLVACTKAYPWRRSVVGSWFRRSTAERFAGTMLDRNRTYEVVRIEHHGT